MKKVGFLGLFLALTACVNTVGLVSGAENLVELKEEPTACKYLYEITSNTSVYNVSDAKRYLMNQIVEMDIAKNIQSNAFFISETEIKENGEAVFGPRNNYMNKAKVYLCPMHKDSVIIKAPENSLKIKEVRV